MQVEQTCWMKGRWLPTPPRGLGDGAQLALLFGSPTVLRDRSLIEEIRHAYPAAQLFGCSTAGEICGTRVFDESLVATGVHFERTRVACAHAQISGPETSFDEGLNLARSIERGGLRHAFVLSDGLHVNGSALVAGIKSGLPDDVTVTGGLSGDGSRFQETLVMCDDVARPSTIAILGFYGTRFSVGYGSLGGWDPFGPERLITRSRGSVLYELDGQSALTLYKRYLGDHAAGLPATGLLFPLTLRVREGEVGVVRTILAVDEREQSMTFAGDVPEGSYARLMKANFDRLIEGASTAAKTAHAAAGRVQPELAVLISCVGRKLVLKQRVEEEVEGVREILGSRPTLTGFYSYGEISPFTPSAKCELHNQTMTITTLSEAA